MRVAGIGASALIVGLALSVPAARADEISPADPFPTRGLATSVSVLSADGSPVAGAEVCAVYRPGSQVPLTEGLGKTDSLGQVEWKPAYAGLACLSATWSDSARTHSSTSNVSIRFDRVRPEGVVVAIAAGLILYSSVILGFSRMRS